uniref:Uncharacterized protein n=1 Tax=Hippocampus comes TaxID=109280 RepID=A0A3Q2XJ49_HIPCM
MTLRCMRKVTYQREEAAAHSLCPVVSPAQLRPCNTQACPPGWNTGAWSQCSKSCGRGLRKRSVFCQSADPGAVVPDSMCRQNQRPKAQESCVLRRCPKNDKLQWTLTSWGECSVSCGGGVQTRGVQCVYQGRPASGCLAHQRPVATRACNTQFCPRAAPPPQHHHNRVTAVGTTLRGKVLPSQGFPVSISRFLKLFGLRSNVPSNFPCV